MKKIILFGCFLVIMGLLTSCGKKTMKNQVEGELIKDFVDDEKRGLFLQRFLKLMRIIFLICIHSGFLKAI